MTDEYVGFRRVRLGDVLTLQRGFDLAEREREPGDVPVVSSSGITGMHNVAKVAAPGVVTGRYGTLGEVFYLEEDFWPLNTALFVSDFKGNDPRFISYFLKTLQLGMTNVAGAVPGVNRNVIHAMEVSFPSLLTQRRIAEILSAYDDLIENNRRRMALLEEAMHLLYREWFVRLRFPGHEQTPVVDGLPEGWLVQRIEDIGEVITGKTPSTQRSEYYGGEVPFIRIPDMHGQVHVIETSLKLTQAGADSQSNKHLPPGSIAVSCIGSIGEVALVPALSQANQQINAVIPVNLDSRYYCYFLFKGFKQNLEALGSNGTTMGNVNKRKFQQIRILWPTSSVLHDFHAQCEPAFSQILTLQYMNRRLAEARDLLLPRLMNGTLTV